jgi:uncharacterized protein
VTFPTQRLGPVSPLATEQTAVEPIGLDQVVVTGGFWAHWQRLNREVTIPHALSWLERDGSVDNLRRLRTAERAAAHRGLWFSDSDVYKVLEGISWDLGRAPSDELIQAAGDLVAVVEAAQEDDGYINSFAQAGHEVRWDNLIRSHEFYCIGHLIQAGIAHKRSTGRTELFEVARRAADCIVRDFGGSRRKDTDGHPEIEMALVELYRETGQAAYLELAEQLVDVRGHRVLDSRAYFDAAYFQEATPVREQTTVVGHAVRAVYLLAGVVDLYLETGERLLLDSAIHQWEAMTASKTYLNGAIGSRFEGEAFGDPYELPQDLVYGETCATIGSIMLAWRLLLATGQGRFADAIERALHNLFAASTSIGRNAFFYSNPAQRRSPRPSAPTEGRPHRAEAPGTRPAWFDCACCPPNIMRTVASLAGYVATHTDKGIQLHQYLPVTIHSGAIGLTVATRYPVDGAIEVAVTETPPSPWTLSLRVPGWCRGATATVNGTDVERSVDGRGYLSITRAWRAGDVVALSLPMPLRLTVAHPAVDAVRAALAIERGPVVYCLESPDQPGVDLNHVELLADEPLVEELREDFLGQPAVVARVHGIARDDSAWRGSGWATFGEQPAHTGRRVILTAIPYHLWANRGPSVMRIFVPVAPGSATGGPPVMIRER